MSVTALEAVPATSIFRAEPATPFTLLASILLFVIRSPDAPTESVRLPLVRPSTSPARVKPSARAVALLRVTLFAATRSISLIVSMLAYSVSSFRARTSLVRTVLPITLVVVAPDVLVEVVVASRITLPVPVILEISAEVPAAPCPVALSIISFRVLLTSSVLAVSSAPADAPEARADRFRLGASWLAVTIFSIPDIEVNLPAKLPVPSVRVSLPAPPSIDI